MQPNFFRYESRDVRLRILSTDKNNKTHLHFADLAEAANKQGLEGYTLQSVEMEERRPGSKDAFLVMKYTVPSNAKPGELRQAAESERDIVRAEFDAQKKVVARLTQEVANLKLQLQEAWRHIPDRVVVETEPVPGFLVNREDRL